MRANVGFPDHATAAIDEAFFVRPNLFAQAFREEMTPEGGAEAAEAELKRIFAKWA
jgi:multiple sugar transport system substrate-binding protein